VKRRTQGTRAERMKLTEHTSKMFWVPFFVVGFLGVSPLAEGRSPELEGNIHITEKTDLSLFGKTVTDDFSGYREFIENNRQHWRPVEKADYLRQIEDAQDYLKAHPSGKTAKDLRQKILEELNIDFLLRGFNARALTVTLITQRFKKGFIEKELLFEDPQVGTFPVFLLMPGKEKIPHAAIIGCHGHDGTFLAFDRVFGKTLVAKGFTVIMPTFRSFYIPIDVIMSEELYSKGFTLMGLRVYETLLLIKYLRYKGYDPIGVMGHSAGSDVAYLTAILDRNVKALVYDISPNNYLLMLVGGTPECETLPAPGTYPHCEVIPGLAYYGPQMNDAATLKIPSRRFEYEYSKPGDLEKVAGFFEANLTEKGGLEKTVRVKDAAGGI